jgi:hypothetical protein
VLISSRSFEEYLAMFGLTREELAGRVVVDVAAGGADFTAGAVEVGAVAIAIDSSYALGQAGLAEQLDANIVAGLTIVDHHPDRFTWRWYGDRASRDELRRRSAARFLTSSRGPTGHYVAGELPRLPVRDRAADLVLCSHLLFTWSDVLDRDWHRDAILELARIGGEVRIFPVVVQGTGADIEWLPDLCHELGAAGLDMEQRQVPYEFQVGADRMLVVSNTHGPPVSP